MWLPPRLLEAVLPTNLSGNAAMSLEQILEELPKLTSEERRRIFELLAQLESQNSQALTPAENAAIDEAIRSLDAGKGIPASEVRQRFAARWSR